MELDFHSHLPVYLQIVRQVQRLASSNNLHPGDQLPTVRELAVQLGVNFNTVARAYRLLHRDGLVSAQRGRGTYLLERSGARHRRTITLELLASQYIAEATRHNFAAPQILETVARQLRSGVDVDRAGDNHE